LIIVVCLMERERVPSIRLIACFILVAGSGLAHALTLSDVAQMIGADAFHSLGYTGSRSVIANIEPGHASPTHDVLDDRIAFRLELPGLAPLSDQDHATQVSGAMVGHGFLDNLDSSPTGPGIAFGSTLWTGRVATSVGPGGTFTFSGNSMLWPLMVAGQLGLQSDGSVGGPDARRADVINSSFGIANDTANLATSILYDHLALQGATLVAAAGNRGSGPATVDAPANSWNVIAVGSTEGFGPFEQEDPSSSGGSTGSFNLPATRTRPDLVAPGDSVQLPTGPGDADFTFASGSSVSSAVVAASAALLIDLGKDTGRATDPRLVKALLMNSADKLEGWNQQIVQSGDTRINSTPVDEQQGAGRVNLASALTQYLASTGPTGSASDAAPVDPVGWSLATAVQGQSADYFFDSPLQAGSEFTATLAWFMDRSVTGFDPDSPNPFLDVVLSNLRWDDLDLFLYRTDDLGRTIGDALAASISGFGNANRGWDSVEHLHLTLPESGRYLLRVQWTAEMFDGASLPNSDLFALAWSATEIPEPGTAIGVLLLLLPRRLGRRRFCKVAG
jgi:hypothetical protein